MQSTDRTTEQYSVAEATKKSVFLAVKALAIT